jgi:2-keto-3-deoxy-L-rhamnonate aldolase RhmA
MPIVENTMKRKLEAGGLAASLNVMHWRGVNIAGIARECGFDWLFIDLEHNSMDLDTAAQLCVAALPTGVTPIVRVPSHDQFQATRILDGGAMGVVVPHVDTPEQARRIVANCKYPPVGHRSLTAPLPQLGFATVPAAEAIEILNRNTLVIVMLETPLAIANADAIAAVDGVDGLLIGTNDLSAEMSLPGQFGHARIEEAYRAMIAACSANGKFPGMGGVYDHALMEKFIGLGVRFLLGGGDVALMMSAGRSRTAFLRGIPLEGTGPTRSLTPSASRPIRLAG